MSRFFILFSCVGIKISLSVLILLWQNYKQSPSPFFPSYLNSIIWDSVSFNVSVNPPCTDYNQKEPFGCWRGNIFFILSFRRQVQYCKSSLQKLQQNYHFIVSTVPQAVFQMKNHKNLFLICTGFLDLPSRIVRTISTNSSYCIKSFYYTEEFIWKEKVVKII